MHLYLDYAVALAGFAAAALDVEGEAAGAVTVYLGVGGLGKEGADVVEDAGIGRGVGARRASDRRLVDADDLVEVFDAVDALMRSGTGVRAVEL